MNSLERAVLLLEKNSGLSGKASEEEILAAIREQEDQLKKVKDQLIKNVPYRALAPFMPEIAGNDKIWNSTARVIEYIHGLNAVSYTHLIINTALRISSKSIGQNEKDNGYE